jgi:hypothetical protein
LGLCNPLLSFCLRAVGRSLEQRLKHKERGEASAEREAQQLNTFRFVHSNKSIMSATQGMNV